MRPIYFLKRQVTSSTEIKTDNNQLNDTAKRLSMQKEIATGHMTCMDLVNSIEDIMGCMLQRIVIQQRRIAFIFEWYEEPLFYFMIAFEAPMCNMGDMVLHRSDLYVAHQVDITDETVDVDFQRRLMMGADGEKMEEIPAKKAESFFIAFYGQKVEMDAIENLKSCQMTYLTYGYILNEKNKDSVALLT